MLRTVAPKIPSTKVQVAVAGLAAGIQATDKPDDFIKSKAFALATAANVIREVVPKGSYKAPPAPTPWWDSTIARGAALALAGTVVLALILTARGRRALPEAS